MAFGSKLKKDDPLGKVGEVLYLQGKSKAKRVYGEHQTVENIQRALAGKFNLPYVDQDDVQKWVILIAIAIVALAIFIFGFAMPTGNKLNLFPKNQASGLMPLSSNLKLEKMVGDPESNQVYPFNWMPSPTQTAIQCRGGESLIVPPGNGQGLYLWLYSGKVSVKTPKTSDQPTTIVCRKDSIILIAYR